MIYSIYKESTVAKKPETVDYFAESVDSGIQIPQGLTSSQFDAFVAGIAESAMLTCFEKIGIAESMYFTEAEEAEDEETKATATKSGKNGAFEAVKAMFGKLLEVAKNFFGGIISWFGERIKSFKDQFTKEGNFKILEKRMMDSKYKMPKENTIILKTKIINPNEAIKKDTKDYYKLDDFYNKITMFASKVAVGNDDFESDEALTKAAFTKIGFPGANSIKEFKSEIVKKYTGEYEITFGEFFNMWDGIKAYVLGGSQKNTIKKLFQDYKKTLNGTLDIVKNKINKNTSKDEKNDIRSSIAKVKDLILIADTYGRTIANLEQKRYLEAMAMAVNGVKAAGKAGKSQEKAAKDAADKAADNA